MLTVLSGRTSATLIPNFKYEGIGEDILKLIEIGNDVGIQSQYSLNALLAGIERVEGVGRGAKLPIEHFNVYFQKGGIESASVGMMSYIESFTLEQSEGWNVMTYDYSITDMYNAENEGINLNADALRKTSRAVTAYQSNYLAFSRLCALLTGSNRRSTIPTEDTNGTKEYTEQFGFLNGEKVADWLSPTAKDEQKYHYRGIKGDTISKTDIYDVTKLLTSYRTYSKKGIMALASPSVIYDLVGDVIVNTGNQDTHTLGGINTTIVPRPFGCRWVPVPEMEGHDFIIFLDEGRKDIIFRRVEKSPKFRGIATIAQEKIPTFNSLVDIKGAKLRIFPEEWYLTAREAGAILDIKNKAQANGKIAEAGKTALEGLALSCQKAFDFEKVSE
ncbi:MAG: hypothetical protein ACRCRT_00955 [Cetobacterium somerae]